jgi:SAM-dependent methyltransferase
VELYELMVESDALIGPNARVRSEARLEYVCCNLCGADDPHLLFQGWDRLHGKPGRFRMVQCQECGLIYLNPRPVISEIDRYYPADYPPHLAPVQAAKGRISRWDVRYGLNKRLRALTALQPRGRLLDVGCATGAFIAFAREQGWDVHGVELADTAASFCRNVLHLPVVTGDLLQTDYPAESFDVITLWTVLEHLHDPLATLHEIRRILQPSGLLALALPNVESLDAQFFGPAWAGYDVPRHLYIMPNVTLERMLAQAGFSVVRRRCLYGSHFLFFFSLQYCLLEKPSWQWARAWVRRLENSPLVRLLMAPYFRIVDALGKGPIVTVFAQKNVKA